MYIYIRTGLWKCRSSIDAVTTSRRQCCCAITAAHASIQNIICSSTSAPSREQLAAPRSECRGCDVLSSALQSGARVATCCADGPRRTRRDRLGTRHACHVLGGLQSERTCRLRRPHRSCTGQCNRPCNRPCCMTAMQTAILPARRTPCPSGSCAKAAPATPQFVGLQSIVAKYSAIRGYL